MGMKESPRERKSGKDWCKTPYSKLWRYLPSNTLYARIKVSGKLHVKSLKTDVVTVGAARLADFEKTLRSAASGQISAAAGKLTLGQAVDAHLKQIQSNEELKPRTRDYYNERVIALRKSWAAIDTIDAAKLIPSQVEEWAKRTRPTMSSNAYNNTIGMLRRVMRGLIKAGLRYSDPFADLEGKTVTPKKPELPSSALFQSFVEELKKGGGRFSHDAADLVQFLAFGGFRKGEAAGILWRDVDFKNKVISVRSGKTQAAEREVPIIPPMLELITRLKSEVVDCQPSDRVMQIQECQGAMTRAAVAVGMKRLTHHDLRHLFVTACVEAGVNVSTIAEWAGHSDRGALILKTYTNIRRDHSRATASKVSF